MPQPHSLQPHGILFGGTFKSSKKMPATVTLSWDGISDPRDGISDPRGGISDPGDGSSDLFQYIC